MHRTAKMCSQSPEASFILRFALAKDMAYKEMHGEDRQLKDMMRTTSQKAPIEFEKLAEGIRNGLRR